MGINLGGSYAVCWRCGYHPIVEVLRELTGQPYPVIRDALDSLPRGPRIDSKGLESKGRLIIPSGLQPLSGPHRRYLRGRGFDPDEITRVWGVQGVGIAPRYGWSLFIPIHHQGEVVSWTTRSIGSKGKRYLNAPSDQERLPAKSLLYGEDQVRGAVIVCEGPTDVWRIGPGAVAVMGLIVTQEQIERLSRHPVRVVCFDREPEAERRMNRLVDTLRQFSGETYAVELETGDDVASADQGEIDAVRGMFLG